MRCVILCRTKVTDRQFCTLVLGLDDLQIYRVLIGTRMQPCYGSLLREGDEQHFWNFGRCVEIPFTHTCIGVRPTHPEDSIVERNSCEMLSQRLDPARTAYLARRHLFRGPRTSFPGISIEWGKAFYSGYPTLVRSTAFWEVAGTRLVRDGAPGHEVIKLQVYARDGSHVNLPIKDPDLRQAVDEDLLVVGDMVPAQLVMVGLANPFRHSSGEDRSYMQLLQITV